MREVTKQKIEEKQLLEKIKAKMNQLKEKQKHLKENYIEPEDHFAGMVFFSTLTSLCNLHPLNTPLLYGKTRVYRAYT